MTEVYAASELCELALRKMGQVPPHEQPVAEDMHLALQLLDLALTTLSGEEQITAWWSTVTIPITAGNVSFDLSNYISDDGMQIVYGAYLLDNNAGEDTPLIILRKEDYLEITKKTETGLPKSVFIGRELSPSLYVFPVLADHIEDGHYSIKLSIQTLDRDIDASAQGTELLKIRKEWYLYLMNDLAYQLGSGPVRYLSEQELNRFRTDALFHKQKLLINDNPETGTPNYTKSWGQ